MSISVLQKAPTPGQQNRRRRERRMVAVTLGFSLLAVVVIGVWIYGPAYLAYWAYEPREGDILFHSSPRTRLVNAIEKVTGSRNSHCAIVALRDGDWVVYEAYRGVEVTPLKEFIFRGRDQAFAVYRLNEPQQPHVPAMLAHVHEFLGRPYDARYRLDDEKIYCTELIYKAYQRATGGESLGQLVRLRDLNWQPYEETIEHFEGGPAPLDREIITPDNLAEAEPLRLIYSHRFSVGER